MSVNHNNHLLAQSPSCLFVSPTSQQCCTLGIIFLILQMRKQRLRGVEITGFKSHSLDVGAELGWLGVWLPPALHPGCSVPSLTSASVIIRGFPGGSEGKESACNAGDLGSILGSGRCPGEGNSNPLQDSCLEKSMNRGAWWATVHVACPYAVR